MMQTNQNQDGMIALDDFGNSVGQLMPHQVCKNTLKKKCADDKNKITGVLY